ncbi:hypothetical protein EIK77_007067 [Talaromyces pinophilus]|nr:hypothetical protein EIK77_007067 [Talaromyces pinophilus]PCG90673.1 Methyltransferase type 12 [Penicillium occitanis (nom. inval.)]PCG91506.1 hypothetical protein PENOC_097030 [Penicillium occitanis (nom. inval.)]
MSEKSAQEAETPFLTGALTTETGFWADYIASRPSPSEDFFRVIHEYHTSHGNPTTAIAHDVGTGPGNIAERLLKYYEHVVGSDVNERALAAAPLLIPAEKIQRLTFVKSPAEGLATDGVVPDSVGRGKTDLIIVSECIPLLDAPKALEAFHTLLRPGGTVAIYFYGRPIFTDADDSGKLNAIYDRIATRICQFLLPFKDSLGFPIHQRAAETLVSYLDNIAFPAAEWSDVVRYKWNYDVPLLFNSKEGYDFDFAPVDRRQGGEITKEITDRTWWQDEWDVDRVKEYLSSVYPNYQQRAGDRYREIEEGLEQLRQALGGGKSSRKVTFPVALVLATKK